MQVTDSILISIDFPANAKIASFQIESNGKKTVVKVSAAKLMAELGRLPVEAFNGTNCKKSFEIQVRKRDKLLALASIAQKLIDANEAKSALVKLEELKSQIKLNVSSKYIPTSNFNISRSSALGMVQSTINSVEPK